jgi:hypothetical protein
VNYSAPGGNGSVTASVANGSRVNHNTSVTFTAVPDNGYRVKEWLLNGNVVPGVTSLMYTPPNITAAINVTVVFELIPQQQPQLRRVNFSVDGGNGTITARIVNGAVVGNNTDVPNGSNVVFTAAPNSGFRVRDWRVNNANQTGTNRPGTANTLTRSITADTNVVVRFERIPTPPPVTYTVRFNANRGKGSLSNQTHTVGSSLRLTDNNKRITRSGYVFAGWATTAARANRGTVDYANRANVRDLRTGNGTVNLFGVWVRATISKGTGVRVGKTLRLTVKGNPGAVRSVRWRANNKRVRLSGDRTERVTLRGVRTGKVQIRATVNLRQNGVNVTQTVSRNITVRR